MQHCLDRQDGMVVAKATLRILLYFLLQAKTFLHQLLEQIVKSQSCSYVEITARNVEPEALLLHERQPQFDRSR